MVCDLLEVSTSGYFSHLRRQGADKPSKPGANRRISNEALLAHIRAIHAEVRGEYGWPKMWKELVARGIRVGKERVRRTMQLKFNTSGTQVVDFIGNGSPIADYKAGLVRFSGVGSANSKAANSDF